MGDWRQDLRYAVRALTSAPRTTIFAVLTFAVAIGGNTTLFSLTSAWLLRPLPYDHPDRLVLIRERRVAEDDRPSPVAPADFLSWRELEVVFAGLAAFHAQSMDLTGVSEPEQVDAARVSANLWSVLGVRAAAGRELRPDEEMPGARAVALVSHAFWQRRFGSTQFSPRTITLDGRSVEIVGVAPAWFDFPKGTAVWVPMVLAPGEATLRRLHYLEVVARLRSHVSTEVAQRAMNAETARLEREIPENRGHHAMVVSLERETVGALGLPLVVLQAATGFILLLACANIATLLLARAAARQPEIAVRLALGAERRRIVRQCFAEGLLLATLGGLAGVLVTLWLTPIVRELLPDALRPVERPGLDIGVLIFAVVATAVAGLLTSVAPALHTSSADLLAVLKENQPATSGHRRLRLTGTLVALEVALAIVLLVGAGLAVKSFARLRATDPGFRSDDVLVAPMSLPRSRYAQGPPVAAFYAQALDRIRSLEGVSAAGAVLSLPGSGSSGRRQFTIEGREPTSGEPPAAASNVVTPDYFRAMGIPIASGRAFTDGDASGPRVAIVNESWVRRFLPDHDPLGVILRFGGARGTDVRAAIVGVAGDVRQGGLAAAPAPEIYLPHSQTPSSRMTLVVRTDGDRPGPADLRNAVWSIDRDQPVGSVERLEAVFERDLGEPRLRAGLLSAFGVGALALAVLGLVGLVSSTVSMRVPEIGLRLALGARPSDVGRMVVVDALRSMAAGAVIGTGAALVLTRLARGVLHDVAPADPLVFAGALALLVVFGLLAAYVPATRLTRLDPSLVLRGRGSTRQAARR